VLEMVSEASASLAAPAFPTAPAYAPAGSVPFIPQRQAAPTQTNRGGGLFNDSPRPTSAPPVQTAPPAVMEPPRQSLFRAVTGAFRRGPATPLHMAAETTGPRREPAMADARLEGPRPSVRQATTGEEVGLEVPAFLRRQSS